MIHVDLAQCVEEQMNNILKNIADGDSVVRMKALHN